MDRERLEGCKTWEELAKEIWISNVKYTELEEGVPGKHNGTTLYGVYLKHKRKGESNIVFNSYFSCMCQVVCRFLNDFTEDSFSYASIQAYEVLLNYFNGKYKFKFVPKTIEEFIEFLFDGKKDKLQFELITYLCGVQQRLLKNSLYCKLEGQDTLKISDTKYYVREKRKGETKVSNVYYDINKLSLNIDLENDDAGVGSNMMEIILDDYYEKNSVRTDVESETELFKEDEESIYMYLYNYYLSETNQRHVDNLNTKINCQIKSSAYRNYKKKGEFDNRLNVNDKGEFVYYANGLLDFGYKFMVCNRLQKYRMLRDNSNKRFLIDIIYSLDSDVYRSLVRVLNNNGDDTLITEYINSKEFVVLCDAIMFAYVEAQNKVKQIVMYNEQQRIEKLLKCERYIKSKGRRLNCSDIQLIFKYVHKEFNLLINTKDLTIKEMIGVMYNLGFVFKKTSDNYILKEVAI